MERKEIREHNVVGTLFKPKGDVTLPGLIIIPGSDGGIPEEIAQHFASLGYVVLALGYFGVEGLPEKLENIPLEYFENAITWFGKQPYVKQNSIGLIGSSRGGELVLLLGATFPELINAIVAYVPSSVVYGGFPNLNGPAWTHHHKPITPFVPCSSNEEVMQAVKEGKLPVHQGTFEDPFEILPVYLYDMQKYQQIFQEAAIPVENIACPLLILTGEDDRMWPSTMFGNMVMERLDKKGSTIARKHLHFPHAGHAFAMPDAPASDKPVYHPVGKFWCTFGGTAEGNAYATKESWREVQEFLKTYLP